MSSLKSAVAILECFSSDAAELAVTEVAARLSMPKSTVSRLLQTMAEQRLVEQDEVTRRYRVGLLPLRLGQLYYRHVRVVELVEAEIEALVNETGFTGYVGVLNGADVVVLRKRHGRYPVQMVVEPGSRMAAASTAFGKALLARLADETLRDVLLPLQIAGHGDPQTKSVSQILEELDAVRGQQWALGDTAFPGMCAIGAAVGSFDNQQAIGFSLSFPDNAVDPKARKAIAESVVAAARKVGGATADPFWAQPAAHRPSRTGKRTGKQAPRVVN